MTEAPSPARTPLEQAIAWFRRRLGMSAREFYRLSASLRRQAFTVSNVARLDVVTDVWTAIDRALEQGQSLEEFQNQVKTKLLREWAGTNINPATRMETIYRTNVSQAYGAGRHAQQTDPDVLAARPFWMYDALLDSRTSNLCMRLHGTILPATDDFWQTRYPPNHFNCRAGVRALTRAGAERRGGVSPTAPELDPPPGFRAAPQPGEWEPDLSKYPPRVVAAYQRSLGGDPQ